MHRSSLTACLLAAIVIFDGSAMAGGIDTHMHLSGLGEKSMKKSGQAGAGAYRAAADELVKMMDGRNIDKTLVVVVPSKPPQASRRAVRVDHNRSFIREAVERHPGRLYLMDGGATLTEMIEKLSADQVTPKARAAFRAKAHQILDSGAAGFGEMLLHHFCLGQTHSYQYNPPDHPLFLELADIAAARDVPIDVHLEAVPDRVATPDNLIDACSQNPNRLPASLPQFETLLAHNRKARIVWQHIGWDNLGKMTPDLLRGLLKRHANLYLSLRVERRLMQVGGSGLPMPNRLVDESGALKADWLALFQEFPDRFMIGSDEFVASTGGLSEDRGIASFDETWEMADQLPDDLRHKIEGDNARRVYRL